LNLPVSLRYKSAHDFFGVVRIHLATESFEVESLLRDVSHPRSSIAQGRDLLCAFCAQKAGGTRGKFRDRRDVPEFLLPKLGNVASVPGFPGFDFTNS
jgi:hypothetical protein